jgi:hypothetical protein
MESHEVATLTLVFIMSLSNGMDVQTKTLGRHTADVDNSDYILAMFPILCNCTAHLPGWCAERFHQVLSTLRLHEDSSLSDA